MHIIKNTTVNIIVSRNEITPPIGYVMYKRKPLAKGKLERIICGADYEGYGMTIIFGFVQ